MNKPKTEVMKPNVITIEFNNAVLPKWVEAAVKQKSVRLTKWAKECKEMRIKKSMK